MRICALLACPEDLPHLACFGCVPLPYKVLLPCAPRERVASFRRTTPHTSPFPWMFGSTCWPWWEMRHAVQPYF
eukprot:351793-Chlamydomonas_euryale.AAC.2